MTGFECCRPHATLTANNKLPLKYPPMQVGDLMQNLNRFEARVALKKKKPGLPVQVRECFDTIYHLMITRNFFNTGGGSSNRKVL